MAEAAFTTTQAGQILRAAGCVLAVDILNLGTARTLGGVDPERLYTISGPIGLGDPSGDSDEPTVLAQVVVADGRGIPDAALEGLAQRALAVLLVLRRRHQTGEVEEGDLVRAEQEERRDRDRLAETEGGATTT